MRRFGLVCGLCLLVTLGMTNAVFALATLSHSFSTTDNNLVPGSLVSAIANKPGSVELANTNNDSRLVGVAVSANESLLALDVNASQVQVAIGGIADVIVSTLSGDIHAGDQIVVSPISGVGMKAVNSMRSIGVAQGALSTTTPNTATRTITDKNGQQVTVHVGLIPVAIIIGYSAQTTGNQGILGAIQTFASAIAGHNISLLQTLLSFSVAIIAIASLTAVVYGAIRGTIISIGRNPLAGASIYHSLSRVVIIASLIVVVAVVVIYLTLR